jgi:EpsI family protein
MCIAILLGIVLLFARLSGQKNVLATLGPPECNPIPPKQPWNERLFLIMTGVAAAIVALIATILHTNEQESIVPERDRFSALMLEFANWPSVQDRPLDVSTERVLNADDYIVLDLVNPEMERVNLYAAYLERQREGASWHSPRQCLPGGGWQFMQQGIVGEGEERNMLGHPYNRIVMKQGDTNILVYYWYDQRGKKFADEIWMKVNLLWDVATTQRSDGAMIRLMTQVEPEETVADAEARLGRFYGELSPKLPAYIPE